jgi:hypothetical protein
MSDTVTTFDGLFSEPPPGNATPGPWFSALTDPVRAHVAMLHRLATGCSGKLVAASYGYDSENRQVITPKVRHFAIGDVDGMVAAVRDLAGEKFRNVYVPLCVMRADLPDRDKGTEADIVAVLGLVGDFDDAGAADHSSRLPIAPNYVLETSAGRYQTFYLFTRALPMAEAKALAERLKLRARCDHGTADMSHVWRAPGTPNWPSEKKLKVGRSPEPQQVRVAQPWNGSLTDPAGLDRLLQPLLPVAPAVNIITDATPIDLASLSDDLRRLVVDGPAPEDDRSDKFHYVVTTLTEARHSPEAIHDLLAQHPGGVAEKYKDRLLKEIKRCAAKATRKTPQEEFTMVAAGELHSLPTAAPEASRFKIRLARDIKANLEQVWLIKRVLPAGGLAMLCAPPKRKKTFVAIDMAMSVARRIAWHGRKTLPGAVLYITPDGAIGNRLAAYAKHHKIDLATVPLAVMDDAPNLWASDDAEHVIRSARELKATTGQPVRLIVIDTLARVMGAGDENSTQAMNTVLNSAKRIQRETGAAVLIVHHEGKDASRGSRGSSALPAAIDVAFGMVKDAMRIDLMRDGEEGTTFPFSLWRWTLDRTRTANL